MEDIILGNTVYGISICFHFLNTQFSKAFVLKITLTENRSVTGPCVIQGRTLFKGGHYFRKYGILTLNF